MAGLDGEFMVGPGFSTHLPLIVIEPLEAVDNAMRALMTVHDAADASTGERNTLASSGSAGPAFSVLLRREPGQTLPGKKSYIIELAPTAENNAPEGIPLAGLPKDARWRLQGSTRDKGMLRNGLAYALGREIFPEATPETRYCEVLFKKGDTYQYGGIYILSETLEHLARRLSGGTGQPVLLRYDPERDKQRTALKAGDDLLFGFTLQNRGFSVTYAGDALAAQEKSRLEADLNKIESALHSLKPEVFFGHTSLLDLQTIVDVYIFNSLMLNADQGPVSLHLYRNAKKQLAWLPDWNFDQAIDNAPVRRSPLGFERESVDLEPLSILERRDPVWVQLAGGKTIRDLKLYPLYDIMDGDQFLWFDRLFLSRPFLNDLRARYYQLRRGALAPANISALVDTLALELGPALERDWRRWEKQYGATEGPLAVRPYIDADYKVHLRQTCSPDQELVKINYCLRFQDTFLVEQVGGLEGESSNLFDTHSHGNRRGLYAFLVIFGFLAFTYVLMRKL
ncbi:MAG: hypothetical protein DELT_02755 [Desulfovibrio sp.]